jgi:hypothetical protein
MSNFAVIIEDLTGAQVIGVSKELAERDAVNGEYRFTFGIHTLRIILALPPRAVAEEPAALPAVL